jgi:hypothetical protein
MATEDRVGITLPVVAACGKYVWTKLCASEGFFRSEVAIEERPLKIGDQMKGTIRLQLLEPAKGRNQGANR